MAMGFSTPKSINKIKTGQFIQSSGGPSAIKDEGGITIEDFDKKLILKQGIEGGQDLSNNYILLAEKSRIGRILQNAKHTSASKLVVNKSNDQGGDLLSSRSKNT
jgi:hypothetical protein